MSNNKIFVIYKNKYDTIVIIISIISILHKNKNKIEKIYITNHIFYTNIFPFPFYLYTTLIIPL